MNKEKEFFSDIAKDIISDLGSKAIRKILWGIICGDGVISLLLVKFDFLQLTTKGNMFAFIVYLLMILGLIAVFVVLFYWVKGKFKKPVVVSSIPSPENSLLKTVDIPIQTPKLSFTQKREIATDEIIDLMNSAMAKTEFYSAGIIVNEGDPDYHEQYKAAFESGKKFHEYLADNIKYFDRFDYDNMKRLDDDFIYKTIRDLTFSRQAGFTGWDEASRKFKTDGKELHKKILTSLKKYLS